MGRRSTQIEDSKRYYPGTKLKMPELPFSGPVGPIPKNPGWAAKSWRVLLGLGVVFILATNGYVLYTIFR